MRVWQLAKCLGVDSKAVMQYMRGMGLTVRSASSMVEPILADTVRACYPARGF